MTQPALDLIGLWTVILGLGVFFYVLLDGFDLGVGILHGIAPQPAWRTTMMNSIAPVWDGNETWLVLGGIGLLAAFPLAFAIIIPAVYFPILIMLLGLIFRGVAFEFRYKESDKQTLLGPRLLLRLRRRHLRAGRRARRLHPGLRGAGPQLRRHVVRLVDAVLAPDRGRPAVRLHAARRRLAGHEDRRRAAGLGAPHGPAVPDRRRDRDRHRQHLDAADELRHRRALVLVAEHRLPVAGAGHHGAADPVGVALAQQPRRRRRPSSARSACS